VNHYKSSMMLWLIIMCLYRVPCGGEVVMVAGEVLISNVWVETSIKTALADLALASGKTIIPDTDLDGTVSLELTEVPFEEALYRVVVGTGAVYREIADGVYLVGLPDAESATFNALAVTEVVPLDYYTAVEVIRQIPLHLQPYVREGVDRIVISAPSALLEQIKSIVHDIDDAPVQVVIEAVILEVTEEAARNLGIEAFLGETRESQGGGLGTTEQDFFDMLGSLQTGEAVYTLGRIRGKIGDIEVGIEALVERGDAKIHANPRIITFEGRPAQIQAGSDVYVTILTGSINYQYAQLQEVKTGTILTVTPHVAKNGEITLEIEPEVSGIVDRGSRALSNVSLEVTVRRAKTQARVQSGETIVLGGLLQESSQETRTKVPILGDLPIVGPLFRSKSTSKTKTELIILITPYLYTGKTGNGPTSPALQKMIEETTAHQAEEPPESVLPQQPAQEPQSENRTVRPQRGGFNPYDVPAIPW